jgi:FKBP-type peptidyl-prolyl cis-trans isomerase
MRARVVKRGIPILLAIAVASCHREPEHAPASAPRSSDAATTTEAPSGGAAKAAEAPPAEAVPRTVDRGDGLRVEITKDGYGPPSKIGDEVSVVYTARAKSNDQVIASSRDWAAPLRLKLGEKGVLPGLARALEGLRAGTIARIEIPPALAYGKEGNPGSNVPADETLVVDVEILGLR